MTLQVVEHFVKHVHKVLACIMYGLSLLLSLSHHFVDSVPRLNNSGALIRFVMLVYCATAHWDSEETCEAQCFIVSDCLKVTPERFRPYINAKHNLSQRAIYLDAAKIWLGDGGPKLVDQIFLISRFVGIEPYRPVFGLRKIVQPI